LSDPCCSPSQWDSNSSMYPLLPEL
jgi:hypothetical protein